MTYTTIEATFAALPDHFDPEAAKDLNATYSITLTQNKKITSVWQIIISNKSCTINKGGCDNPVVALQLEEKNWLKICNNQLSGIMAALTGRLKVKGSILIADRLMMIFPHDKPAKSGQKVNSNIDPDNLITTTLSANPELADQVYEIMLENWPAFILNDNVGSKYWLDIYQRFPEHQVILRDRVSGTVVGVGNSIPFNWVGKGTDLPDDGWQWAISKGMDDYDKRLKPNCVSALAATVPKEFRAFGLGSKIIEAMKKVAVKKEIPLFVAPVRPNQKCLHPEMPILDYMVWNNNDGEPRDPWLRIHTRLGAKMIKPCMNSVVTTATLDQWKAWTGVEFTKSGFQVVPEGLVPVDVRMEDNLAHYVEPNVWMVYPKL